MKGRQDRRTGNRQIGIEIDTMEVHEVDRFASQHGRDRGAVFGLRFAFCRLVQHTLGPGDRPQLAVDAGSRGRHDDRTMAGRHEGTVQGRQDLLGAAGCVGGDARQGIADTQHREAHSGSPRSDTAPRTRLCQRSPVRFQP